MAIKRLGAQRFSGLEADVNNLPIDADLTGAIFNSTDTLKFWIFNGTVWNESAGGGGITGLEPNSTILEYSTDILDYTTPTSATATSGTPANAIDGNTTTFWQSDPGANESITLDMGSAVNCYGLAFYIDKVASGITETQFQIQSLEGSTPNFTDDYSSSTPWTQTGSSVTVDDGAFPNICKLNATLGNSNDRVTRTFGFTLDNSLWVARMKYTLTSITGGLWIPFLMGTNGELGESGTTSNVGIFLRGNSAPPRFDIWSNDSGTTDASANGIEAVAGTTYYFEFARTSLTNVRLTVYTDVNYSILAPVGGGVSNPADFTIPAGIVGLDTLNHGANFPTSGGAVAVTCEFDDMQVWDGTSTVPAGTVIPIRTVSVADLVDQQYNFIRFNGVRTQTLIIEGSSGSSLVMAANELAVQLETDPPLTTLHGQFTINGTNASLALNGGDPTSSVIDDPSTNSMTLVSAVEQGNPPTDGMVMWNEILDANNSVSHSKMKIDGAIKNVRWF